MSITPVAGRANRDLVLFGIAEETVRVSLSNTADGTTVSEGGEVLTIGGFTPRYIIRDVRPDEIDANTESFVINGNAFNNFLIGAAGDDQIGGGEGRDRLVGVFGDDILRGNAGRDELAGGNGNDLLLGGEGRDGLNGGFGNDVLDGGMGRDGLFGGGGDDVFVLRRFETQGDRIADFEGANAAGGDVLRFVGFGPGARVDYTGAGFEFVVTDDLGAREVFTLEGAGFALGAGDVIFA